MQTIQQKNKNHNKNNENNKNNLKKVFKKIALVLPLFLMVACSALPDKYDATLDWSETKLFQEGKEALDSKSYVQAAKHFQTFEGRFPLSPLAKQALFNSAYAQYKNKEMPLASQTIQRFIELYPNHEQVDYAYYLRGLIYFNDDLGLLGRFAQDSYDERDPKSMQTSYAAFKALIERFPQSQYTPDALERMRFIVNALAKHEVKIATYYYKRGAFLAASQRAEMVLLNYDRAPAIRQALEVMRDSYNQLGLKTQAKAAADLLQANFADAVNNQSNNQNNNQSNFKNPQNINAIEDQKVKNISDGNNINNINNGIKDIKAIKNIK